MKLLPAAAVLVWLGIMAFFAGVVAPAAFCTLDHVNKPISLVQLRFGEHLIDLLPGERAEGGGLDHFCLSIRCGDLGRVRDELRARGVTVDGDVVPRRGAFGSGPSLYVQDPDGYRIELKPR